MSIDSQLNKETIHSRLVEVYEEHAMNGRNVCNLEDRVDAHIPENRRFAIDLLYEVFPFILCDIATIQLLQKNLFYIYSK
jgi:hypothetical protein